MFTCVVRQHACDVQRASSSQLTLNRDKSAQTKIWYEFPLRDLYLAATEIKCFSVFHEECGVRPVAQPPSRPACSARMVVGALPAQETRDWCHIWYETLLGFCFATANVILCGLFGRNSPLYYCVDCRDRRDVPRSHIVYLCCITTILHYT